MAADLASWRMSDLLACACIIASFFDDITHGTEQPVPVPAVQRKWQKYQKDYCMVWRRESFILRPAHPFTHYSCHPASSPSKQHRAVQQHTTAQ
jgi:hypothetical protein